jgi:ribose transport system substrate-binding protein
MQKAVLFVSASAIAIALSIGSAAAAGKNVAVVLGVKGSPFYEALACGAKAKAKELGLNVTISAGDQFAADAQIPVVNAVAATKPDVAVIVPTDMQALVGPMKQIDGMGTKVLTVDQTIADTSFVQTQILTDNEAGGKLAADAINELLGGAQDARTSGFEAELKKYPGIEYLGAQYQSDDPQKAAEIVTSTLSAHPDLAGIFATNDQGAIGAITGLKQAGAGGKVKVVAYDSATAEVNALKNGTIQALIAQNPKLEGEVAMEIAQKLLDGKPVEKTTLTEIATIKAGDNASADKYEYKGDCQ